MGYARMKFCDGSVAPVVKSSNKKLAHKPDNNSTFDKHLICCAKHNFALCNCSGHTARNIRVIGDESRRHPDEVHATAAGYAAT
jgi:hypothetical protein